MNNILLVCVGNICRSPVAEALLKAQFPDKNIWSAGLAALVGKPADPLAQAIAAEHGLDISAHRAQQLTSWMCAKADLLLVMEEGHKQELANQYPLARGKSIAWATWAETGHTRSPTPTGNQEQHSKPPMPRLTAASIFGPTASSY